MRIVVIVLLTAVLIAVVLLVSKKVKRERLVMILKERMGFTDQQLQGKTTEDLQAMVDSMK